jgi:hypothetical protein
MKDDKQPVGLGMLRLLNSPSYNMYAGTVPERIVQQRRKKNKEARKARRRGRK